MDLKLSGNLGRRWSAPPFVARLNTRGTEVALALRAHTALLLGAAEPAGEVTPGLAAVFRHAPDGSVDTGAALEPSNGGERQLPAALGYLKAGDIVRVSPAAGEVRVLYRHGSPHNVLFFTERCNSRCLMCSQPPREVDDAYHLDDLLAAIPLMDPDPAGTPELCITGGEPLLAGERLFGVVRAVRTHLPATALHLLSNGRLFRHLSLARGLAGCAHPDLMVGVPLYSDLPARHDFVVQARGAFDETIRGLLNLARVGVRVEIRVVLHRQTVGRLRELARFLAANLPFTAQVVLMGLEPTGFARSNWQALWVDPHDYRAELAAAVTALATARMRVMVYNMPLCVLAPEVRPFARRSISDWKNVSLPVCESCGAKTACAGFFTSGSQRHSAHLHPLVSP